ncbi:phage tail protein [Pantoea stewartii subsp. stewartii]
MCNCFSKNLGLKEAAKRDVGTGANQMPDMSAWTQGGGTNAGWRKTPDGFIEQWGRATFADGANITLPIPFPNAFLTVAVTSHPSDTGGVEVVQGYPVNLSAFRLGAAVYQGGSFAPSSNLNGIWFAKAK